MWKWQTDNIAATVFFDYDTASFLSDATDVLRPGVYRYTGATTVTSFHGYDRVLLIQCTNMCHWCVIKEPIHCIVSELFFTMIFRYVSFSEILNSDVTKVEAFGTIDNWRFI